MTRCLITRIFPRWLWLAMIVLPASLMARQHHSQQRPVYSVRDRVPRVIVLPEAQSWSSRPPGWDRGRKTGWGGCSVPPGHAKKSGCSPKFFTGGRNQFRLRPVLIIPLP